MKNVDSKISKIKFESGISPYKENYISTIYSKNKTIKKINKGKINSPINIKRTIPIILLKYIILKLLFFPVFSLENNNKLSEITVKITETGKQPIFRKRGTCLFPDKVIDISKNLELENLLSHSNDYYYVDATQNESKFELIWNAQVKKTCIEMFIELSNIIEVDLSKLGVSLKDMGNLFKNCSSLTYVNLTNVDTSQTINLGNMFANCISLTSLDLSSFDTAKVSTMDYMFYNCTSLTSLNLSNFDTSQVTFFKNMFYNCNQLTSLKLSNFDFSSLKYDRELTSMFFNCSKLNYLNIEKYQIKSERKHSIIEQIIGNTTKNLVICINANDYGEFQEHINQNICPTLDCSEKFHDKQKKIIKDNNMYVEKCNMTGTYIYEYENFCYNNCPQGTCAHKNICYDTCSEGTYQNSNSIFLSKVITTELITNSEEKIEEKILTTIKIPNTEYNSIVLSKNSSCPIINFFMNQCKQGFIYEDEKDAFKYDIIASISNGSLSELLNQVVNNSAEFVIKEGNDVYQISTVSNQMNIDNNLTNINFSECEAKLRKELGFEDDELVILKIEHSKEGYKIPVIEYALFLENGTSLSLHYCDNISSIYYIPVSINEKNLFMHNTSSKYYNDECSKYTTENGTDMTMYDRKNNYNENHLSLCEANCIYKGYNSSTSKAECECKTKSDLYTVDALLGDDL